MNDFITFLTLIKEAWHGSTESLRKEIIGGMWVLFTTYKTNLDLELAARKFQLVNPIDVIREGKALKHIPGDAKYAYVLATYYNKNQRKNKLDLSRLTQ